MTKAKLLEELSAILIVGEKITQDKMDSVVELVGPKKGGASVDVNEVAVFDAEGNVTHLLCSLSVKWIPVFDAEGNANFYEDTKSDRFGGWKRLSRAAEAVRKKSANALKATKDAVLADMLNPDVELTQEEANAKIAACSKPDYSEVEGLDTKPE